MSSYLDTLMADRDRLRQSLVALIEEEAARVRELQDQLDASARKMDQYIVRLTIYRELYGPSATQTLELQTAIEDHGKPHGELTAALAEHQRVLQAMQEALLRLEQGGRLDAGAARGTDTGQTRKLSIAEILGGE